MVFRGWTLQELIGPPEVIFYTCEWRRIGYRSTDKARLSEITGISDRILGRQINVRATLDDFPIATRMSWAAKRETTRVEDTAYCLLGLFDVNMPLLYGEGMKAFKRLQEEILKSSDDFSLFAWGLPENLVTIRSSPQHPSTVTTSSRIERDRLCDSVTGLLANDPSQFNFSWDLVKTSIPKSPFPIPGQEELDFPLPPVLMNKGIRIEMPIISSINARHTGSGIMSGSLLTGLGLCQRAWDENVVCLAALNCTSSLRRGSRQVLAVPLVAWEANRFGRWGQPGLYEVTDLASREVGLWERRLFLSASLHGEKSLWIPEQNFRDEIAYIDQGDERLLNMVSTHLRLESSSARHISSEHIFGSLLSV